ncbi:MAG: TlpA disulfide reductase family protein [Actinobacteria bacterium]|nr:TlpA disulfide reductase family protein [Actinomycetota bacterium]
MNRGKSVPYIAGAAGVLLLAFLVILAMAKPGESESASSPLLGNPAPVVKSTTIGGGPFDLSHRKGSWVVLNFFNSTCVPCRQEHPLLIDFAKEQKSSDNAVELYTIVNDDSDGAVRAFFDTYGGDWPVVRDDDGAISVAFGVAKVPESWVIDPNGFVRLRIMGALTKGFLTARLDELKTQFAGGQ